MGEVIMESKIWQFVYYTDITQDDGSYDRSDVEVFHSKSSDLTEACKELLSHLSNEIDFEIDSEAYFNNGKIVEDIDEIIHELRYPKKQFKK